MAENSLIGYVTEGMKPYWRKPIKHADAFTSGVADLSGFLEPAGTVWIELKALHKWPVRATTVVKLGFDDLQKEFLLERKGWLFVRVRREYLLYHPKVAYEQIEMDFTTRQLMNECASAIWKNSVDWKKFASIISKRPKY